MTEQRERVTVIGDGGWGTALALVLTDNGHRVTLWGHDGAYLDEMRGGQENTRFLPGVALPEALAFEGDLARAVAEADLVVSAVPTKFLRTVYENRKGLIPAKTPVVSVTKGLEVETLLRPTGVLEACLGIEKLVVLSGPSHAEEVARRLPTTVVAACGDEALAARVQTAFMNPSFRVYTSRDVLGVELGGALKNVIAIAAGICVGLELGDNALAALITRGMAEMARLGEALGADPLTFAGLSGMGDLVVTCTSRHGRNRALGVALGQGKSPSEAWAGKQTVAEGAHTVQGARDLAAKAGVEMPIVEAVYAVLYEGKSPKQAVSDLMTREAKAEER